MAAVNVTCYIVAIFVLQNHLAGGTGCIYGGSSDCVFPCNCVDNTPCDNQTGTCPNGCRYGQPRPVGNETRFDWRGPGCRIGNVALHKVVNQKGVYGKWYANHSVDGKLPSSGSEHEATCSHTAVGEGNAWWSVDLQGSYHIYNITLFNRLDGHNALRTANFTIRVGYSSNISMNPLCLYYPGRVPTGGSATLTCTSSTNGRYVSMHRIGGYNTNIINICEVVVMGYEIITADCSRCQSDCDDLVGCSYCFGYKPPLCLACDSGRYGINCKFSCSDHHCKGGYMTCDHVTGECPDACQPWYIGGKCDTLIDEVQFDEIPSTGWVNATHINVTWGSDADITPNMAQYYGYQVQYKASNESVFLSGPNVSHVSGLTEYSAILSGLQHNTRYTLRVNVYRQHGDLFEVSPWASVEVEVKTQCIAPGPISIVNQAYTLDDKYITLYVEWKTAHSKCARISSIQLLYRGQGYEEWMAHDVINPMTSTSVRLSSSGIIEDYILEIKIRIVYKELHVSESQTHTVQLSDTATVSTIAVGTNHDLPNEGFSNANQPLVITFAALFGISAVISIVVLIHCIRIKIHHKRTNTPSTLPGKTPEPGPGADNYEGLVGPLADEQQSPYDALQIEERQGTAEPEYVQME